LKTLLKTLIGSGAPDHITWVAQHTLTFSDKSKGVIVEMKRVVSGVASGVAAPGREKI
jgi:hypothetical protein